jgi:hypothetical protein
VRFSGLAVATALLLACDSGGDAAPADAGAPDTYVRPTGRAQLLTHTFPPFDVAAPDEQWRNCQSWTLGNDAPLFVNRVTATNEGAWHHSNWMFVRQNLFQGPDGTWPCRDRGYNEVSAGLNGGVFFAQSTQALTETQQFPPGAAIRLPPHTRVLGNVHLLNASSTPMTTAMTFEVETLDEEDVHTRLAPMSYTYTALDIAPRAQSRFVMECDVGTLYQDQLARAPDFRIYYVLPHYHALGNFFRIELVGGENDGGVVYETGAAIGDALGQTLDPPVEVRGATALRITCGFDNPTDAAVRYGIGDQEMCVFLAFTDSPLKFVGTVDTNEPAGQVDGIHMNRGTCESFGVIDL